MSYPRVTWHPDGSAADVTFPFDAFVVAEIKRVVPAWLRSYDPDSKTWMVDGRYVHLVYHVLAQVFGDVDVEAALVVLHLRPTAPPELVDAAYKCLARLHHPDRGGSTITMQMINHAVESIREAS